MGATNSKTLVKEIMKIREHNNRTLAKKLGYVSKDNDVLPSGVTERLRGTTDMRVDTLVKFLEALDCELVIRSTKADKLEWIIGNEDSKVE